jgi:CheY-like chemotaxis protein
MVYAPNSRETILLVDDDRLVRELSRDLLELDGYRVMAAGDAVEAETLAAGATQFDLLVTDVVMPDITGPALARKIRESRPDLKVLFISGFASKQVSDGSLGKEDAFLAKPFSPSAFARKIREVLDGPEPGDWR